jgi:hypothetical protein
MGLFPFLPESGSRQNQIAFQKKQIDVIFQCPEKTGHFGRVLFQSQKQDVPAGPQHHRDFCSLPCRRTFALPPEFPWPCPDGFGPSPGF